ncbi:MAG: TonB-dependent receptor plug domain-containing protein, partial [Kangiellaceae bacterium]|nr:TonB-dependent receptor plug domain-containing protein [Kangiellaceae bacterium]
MKFQFIGVLVCIFFTPLSAIAEEQLPSDIRNTQQLSDDSSGEIMVILGKVPRPINDVFGAASVISREALDKELVHDIADLVRFEVGISIESAGTRFGLSGFKIRGIGGNRVAIEIDGIPVSDQFDIGSFSNSGRNFIDIDLVQQVEILRGPASSVYGSNAIGGVVSFISKKPVDLLAQTKSDYYIGLKGGFYGVDNSRLFSLSAAMETGKLSGLITLSTSSGNEFDNNTGSATPSDQQNYSTKSILTKVYYAMSDDQQLSLSFDYFERESETDVNAVLGLGRFRNTTSIFGDDQSERYSIALSYEFNPDLVWLEGGVARIYHQESETEQLTDETRFSRGTNFGFDRDFFYQQNIDGLRLNLYTNWGGSNLEHRIGYGLEWSERKITELRDSLQTNLDANTSTNIILSEVFPLRDFPISTVKELGIYLNDEIEIIGTNLSIIPALRFDQYRLDPKSDTIYLEDNLTGTTHDFANGSYSFTTVIGDAIDNRFVVVFTTNST